MHKKLTKRNEQTGFTIIEVVLVLAIAGLIFLIVFLALPALQRSRRDTQRKSDAGRMISALESYAGNNNGSYPTDDAISFALFTQTYLTANGAVWTDPGTGVTYTYAGNDDPTAMTEGQMYYRRERVCNGQLVSADTNNQRDVAVVAYQENGVTSCQDNQ
jgi:prepilin-type N-terminal cleavage/methylation domain-containing protein